jgi:hypothetical protein
MLYRNTRLQDYNFTENVARPLSVRIDGPVKVARGGGCP